MSKREYFVYHAWDAEGQLLYVGRTKRLALRYSEHRSQSDWMHLAVRFKVAGPFTYEVAHQKEREGLTAGRPLYAFHPARQTYIAARSRYLDARHCYWERQGLEFWDAHAKALVETDVAIPYPGNRAPFDVTDAALRRALSATPYQGEAA